MVALDTPGGAGASEEQRIILLCNSVHGFKRFCPPGRHSWREERGAGGRDTTTTSLLPWGTALLL